MAETRGYQTIKDRTSGWGAGYGPGGSGTLGYVDPSLQPTADATPETTDERADKQLNTAGATVGVGRKQGKPLTPPDNNDRTVGYGGEFTPTGGADNGYRDDTVKDIWDDEVAAPATLGSVANPKSDNTFTGTAVEYDETVDSEFLASGRTSTALPTSAVAAHRTEASDELKNYTVSSIVDRTSGWGHTSGSQADRHN